MFKCERCGSRYSAMHTAAENCPRCQVRDRIAAPLTMSRVELADRTETSALPAEEPGLQVSDSPAPPPHAQF